MGKPNRKKKSQNPPPIVKGKSPSKFFKLIEQPTLLVALGFVLALLLHGHPLPAVVFCALLVLLAVYRSEIIPTGLNRWGLIGHSIALLGVGVLAWLTLVKATPWEMERAAPLVIDASVSSLIKRPVGGVIAGIKWKPNYRLLRVYVENKSVSYNIDQIDLSFDLGDVQIYGAGQDGGTAVCKMTPSGELGPAVIDLNSIYLVGKNGSALQMKPASSAKYFVHCDHLPAGNDPIPLVFAVAHIPSQIVALANYYVADGTAVMKKTRLIRQPVKVNSR